MVTAQEFPESGDVIAVSLASPADTQGLAARLSSFARAGDVITLSGDLGAGKTTFARGFISAVFETHKMPLDEVPSPTFTIVQEYQLPDVTLYHIDLYRIDDQADLVELGLEEAFADGVSLIEWPDRLGVLLPSSRLEVTLRQGSHDETQDTRHLELRAFGDWKDRIQSEALDG